MKTSATSAAMDRFETAAFDIYLPSTVPEPGLEPPLLAYVHGGAWRTGDKSDHAETLLAGLASRLDIPIASINYRLSPRLGSKPDERPAVLHPTHEADVSQALALLTAPFKPSPMEGEHPRWRRDRLVLAGHSCGAFMALNLSLITSPSTLPTRPWIRHDPASIVGLVLLDGIFDLVDLVDEYPSYREFVENAFGPSFASPGEPISPTDRIGPPDAYSHDARSMPILLAHSSEDSLLSLRQPRLLASRLHGFTSSTEDYVHLKGDHDDLLDGPEVLSLVAEWFSVHSSRLGHIPPTPR